jgi:hypothetical protein
MTELQTFDEIESALADLNHLQECIIIESLWYQFGLLVDVLINTTDYNMRVTTRKHLPTKYHILRFYLVQEFHILRDLNHPMQNNPEYIDWGINEIALVRLLAESPLLEKYRSDPLSFFHLAFKWEVDSRRIDIVFSRLEIIRTNKSRLIDYSTT